MNDCRDQPKLKKGENAAHRVAPCYPRLYQPCNRYNNRYSIIVKSTLLILTDIKPQMWKNIEYLSTEF